MRAKLQENLLPAAALFVALSACTSNAQLTGEIWAGLPDSVAQNANNAAAYVIANNGTLAHANFSSPAINYFTGSSPTTSLATFLNNPTFFNQANGFSPTASVNDSFVQLTGTIFLNAGLNTFTVTHDDGIVITVAGGTPSPAVNQPGPTGPVATDFNVTVPSAGSYSVTVDYTECCSGPAALEWSVNSQPVSVGTVPDTSATLPLMGSALAALAVLARRLRK